MGVGFPAKLSLCLMDPLLLHHRYAIIIIISKKKIFFFSLSPPSTTSNASTITGNVQGGGGNNNNNTGAALKNPHFVSTCDQATQTSPKPLKTRHDMRGHKLKLNIQSVASPYLNFNLR